MLAGIVFANDSALATPGEPADSLAARSTAIEQRISEGMYAQAEQLSRLLLVNEERLHGPDSPEAAASLDLLVLSLCRGGKAATPESEALARRAVALKEQIYGRDHIELAESLHQLGDLLHLAGRFADAESPLLRSLEIRRTVLGQNNKQTADAIGSLGSLYTDWGRYAEAEDFSRQQQRILELILGPESPVLAGQHYGLARILFRQGKYPDAILEYEQAYTILEKSRGPRHPSVAWVLNGLAIVYDEIHEFIKARDYYERALSIAEASLDPADPFISSCLNNLGFLHRNLGDYTKAEELYRRSLDRLRGAPGSEAYVASTLINIGELRRIQDDYKSAEEYFRLAIEQLERAVGSDSPELATGLRSLASVRLDEGDFAEAESLYVRVLQIKERELGPDHLDLSAALTGLGDVHAMAGEGTKARQAYARALGICRKNLGTGSLGEAEIIQRLGVLDLRQVDLKSAFDQAIHAESIIREHTHVTVPYLPERQAMALAEARGSSMDLMLTVAADGRLPESAARCWDSIVRSRGLVLEMMATRNRMLAKEGDETVRPLAGELASASSRLAELLVQGPLQRRPSEYREEVDRARDRREKAERRLSEKSIAYRTESVSKRLGLSDVRRALPQGAALLAYVRYHDLSADGPPGSLTGRPGSATGRPGSPDSAGSKEKRHAGSSAHESCYAAFLADGGSTDPRLVWIGSSQEVDDLVAATCREASTPGASLADADAESRYRQAARRLREIVWDPMADLLDGYEKVFVVPDGALHFVNLVALPTDPDGYLIDSGPMIHYLSAERDLVLPTRRSSRAPELLALGAPDFDLPLDSTRVLVRREQAPTSAEEGGRFRGGRSPCQEFQSIHFEPLPGTGDEVRAIAGFWNGSMIGRPMAAGSRVRGEARILTGPSATESEFVRAAPGKQVIHLATHGFFVSGQCLAPEPKLRGIGGLARASITTERFWSENPLRLAGLALAGSNHRNSAAEGEEDGILTAEEIAAMSLDGTDWVVLSACGTGLGEIRRSEGVVGLRRAFRVAGAGTTIMSLWSVEDKATLEWMQDLYEARLVRGKTTIEAVHDATLGTLNARRASGRSTHPFYWAAFVAAGDWR